MKNHKTFKAFTLIETIVVIVIIGLVMPLIFAIIFGLVREQTKIFRISQVKREGDYILNATSSLIKNNAQSIHSAGPPSDANERCKNIETYTSSNYRLIFKDKQDYWFRILWDEPNEKISSYSSSTATSTDFNSTSVLIENFEIRCDKTSLYAPATVSISFNVCYKTSAGDCTSGTPEEIATLHYQTKIKLRNF